VCLARAFTPAENDTVPIGLSVHYIEEDEAIHFLCNHSMSDSY